MVIDSKSPSKTKVKEEELDSDIILDTEIDKLLEEKAEKANLTVFNVKSIIRQVILNQMVQQMVVRNVKRKEKEDKAAQNDHSNTYSQEIDPEEIEENLLCYEPKLTRAKTKELIQNQDQSQIPLWPISPAKLLQVKLAPSEAQILITSQDLPEESEAEDDEYIPKESDYLMDLSDDEASGNSMSDIGSPATPTMSRRGFPNTIGSKRKLDLPQRPNDNILFKTPSPKKQIRLKRDSDVHNPIGLRTRSKLPLNDTPLEDLEKQLIPPDITTDMYEWNESDNEDYLNFLKTFMVSAVPDGNDDEEADPEYNVMEDEEDQHDKEEHRVDRAVKVSKKELNELIAELFDGYHLPNENEIEESSSSLTHQFPSEPQPKENTKVLTPLLPKREKVSNSLSTVSTSSSDVTVNISETLIINTKETVDVTTSTLQKDECSISLTAQSMTPTISFPVISEQKHLIPIFAAPPTFEILPIELSEPEILFTPELYYTLHHQIQMHIQLLAQTYVLASGVDDPKVVKVGQSAKALLLEIESYADANGSHSVYSGKNLKSAIGLIKIWPPRLRTNSPIKKKILEEQGYKAAYQIQEGDKEKNRHGLTNYEKSVIKLIGESSAFMYPWLLPPYFLSNHAAVISFTQGEDALIARGMDELKSQKLQTAALSALLSEILLPIRTPGQILNRIKNIRKSKSLDLPTIMSRSPLKDYLLTKTLPTSPKNLFLPDEALPPILQPREVLSQKWTTLVKYIMFEKQFVHVSIHDKKLVNSGTTCLLIPVISSTPVFSRIGTKRKNCHKTKPLEHCVKSAPQEDENVVNLCTETEVSLTNVRERVEGNKPLIQLLINDKESANSGTKDIFVPLKSENIVSKQETKLQKANITSPLVSHLKPTNLDDVIHSLETHLTSICDTVIEENNSLIELAITKEPDIDLHVDVMKPSTSISPRSATKRHKYNTAPLESLLGNDTEADEDIVNVFSEAFLINVRERVKERNNSSLYTAFIQLLSDASGNNISDDDLYKKVEELFKDYPDLVKEFGGLQRADAAFATGNFIQYQDAHAQLYFLQLLEKWTAKCPQLKTKIIQKLKLLQETNLTQTKMLDAMQPIFLQMQNPLIVDAFKALFPSIFRPQTTVADGDYEELDFDVEENKQDASGHHLPTEIEPDHFETVKVPEEKNVIATNTCPCVCHEDQNNVPFFTRAKHCRNCCLRFQDGKLFMHSGRGMKPVNIEFTSPELAKEVLAPSDFPLKAIRSSSSPLAAALPVGTSTATIITKPMKSSAPEEMVGGERGAIETKRQKKC